MDSHYGVDVIYESSNGYYAISAGLIPKTNSRAQVEDFKLRGLVPHDAFCSASGIVAVAAMNPQDAEGKIRAEQERKAAAAASAARLEAERNAALAAAAAAAAEERARRAEAAAAEIIADRERSLQAERDAAAQALQKENESDDLIGTGTGFRIAENLVVTNDHVIQGCSNILAGGHVATPLEQSSTFDLAVLSSEAGGAAKTWLPLSDEPPRLNSDIVVAGYPLHGLLGGINVTRGTISSMRGLGGDDHNMQISAPIQSGNSGGPVVDRFGRVVGVVVSKINNDALKEVAGLSAENVNFAVRGDILQLMLNRYDIPYASREALDEPSPEDLADEVTAATVLIECR